MNGGSRHLAGAVIALVLQLSVAAAETLSGPARLLDGDTLRIGHDVVRLHGIDAPETGQTCQDATGRAYRCGVLALDGLRRLIAGQSVTCTGENRDRYDRLIARCTTPRVADLNRELVRQGLAVAYRRFTDDYLADEVDAFKAGRGIWQGAFVRPWEMRRDRWAAARDTSPAGCPIKGNISDRGRIYHTPYSQYYDRTRINPARGERWFCTEAEALAAGWRAPFR